MTDEKDQAQSYVKKPLLSEHWRDIRVTSVISLATTIVLLGILGTMAYGCHEENETERACIAQGGVYDRHCSFSKYTPPTF